MNVQTLTDLTPLARLLAGAAALSAVALLFWWFRNARATPKQRQQALVLLTLFFTFDLIVVGAFTRLTDSGLGCPDWPGCYGSASPVGAQIQIGHAQDAMPDGPVTPVKAWIEMVHRYLAMAVGGLILVLTALSWHDAWLRRRNIMKKFGRPIYSPGWSAFTLVWVCIQGAFGALTVTMQLFPLIVTMHLLGAYILLAALVLQVHKPEPDPKRQTPESATVSPAHRAVSLALLLVVLQALLGAWVSTNYAVLACNDFPTCQGQWWPPMDFHAGFELWRPLGSTGDGAVLSFQALTAIHYAHRLFAAVVVIAVIALLIALRARMELRKPLRWLGIVLVLQLLTGLSNVVLDWPVAAALMHTAGAGALIAILTRLLALSWPAKSVMNAYARESRDQVAV